MATVNMHDAKTRLSSLVEGLESGRENEIILARNGKPVAKLVPFSSPVRIGAGKHIFAGLDLPKTLEEFNKLDKEIAKDFEESAKSSLFP
ncbi:type II toxin-antitoxin system Phd/YefM family antitoxin [Phyllobacterium endophyticum]|uniref:type II toxin-antitoxin system Phd/YefM family antitoxin n=1 Tax=Phyllobacterium endophyticum TaxID=1149773 RepID=UPI0011C6FE62|nr:type II toxin-antitoxin system Phd/YefM family antitoxin [Phyllobacterium endophyticum]TXR46967.1 antitoxin [Phyllobacterium endophyticum]